MAIVHVANLPLKLRIEGWTKRELVQGTGYQLRAADRYRAEGNEAAAVLAELRCDLLWAGLDQCDQVMRERGVRKLMKLATRAGAMLAVGR